MTLPKNESSHPEAARLQEALRGVEADLRQVRATLDETQQLAGIGSWALDLTSNRLEWSEETYRIFEIPAAEFGASYEAFLALVHPDDRPRVQQAYEDSLRDRSPYELMHRLRFPDGRIKFVQERCRTSFDGAGRPLRSIGTVQDVSDRLRAEERMRMAEQAMDQSFESIVITDLEGRILYVNPAFEKATGYGAAEAVGQETRILNSGRHGKEFFRGLWETITRGEQWKGNLVNKRKDGSLFEEETIICPIRDANGDIRRYLAVKRDLSREQELQGHLRQAQKMESVGRLAGGIAHDFNNLLTAMRGYSDFVKNTLETGDPRRADLEEIQEAVRRASDLTRQILTFSRKQVLAPQSVNVNELLSNLGRMFQRLLGEDVRTSLELSPLFPSVRMDPGQLEQAIINLAVNARDAMPEGGRLTISTATASDKGASWVEIAVRDTGAGMGESTRSRLFEPFFTTKEPGKGTGLGLSTVHGIVHQWGGSIRVESAPGRGSTFTLRFPASPAVPAAAAEVPSQAPSGTETVLLVEDEAALRKAVSRMLREAGYEVLEASRAKEAVELARQRPGFHLLLSDIILPDKSGPALIEELAARGFTPRTLFITGYADRAATAAGGPPLLLKPFTRADILRAVREALA